MYTFLGVPVSKRKISFFVWLLILFVLMVMVTGSNSDEHVIKTEFYYVPTNINLGPRILIPNTEVEKFWESEHDVEKIDRVVYLDGKAVALDLCSPGTDSSLALKILSAHPEAASNVCVSYAHLFLPKVLEALKAHSSSPMLIEVAESYGVLFRRREDLVNYVKSLDAEHLYLELRRLKLHEAYDISALSNIKGLRWLNLCFTDITDSELAYLAGLKNLHGLELYATKITDSGLAYLSGLSELRVLNLGDTEIADSGIAHLAELKNLHGLSLSSTKIDDPGLAYLSGLKELRTLDLWRTKTTDSGIAHLAQLTNLRVLNLVGTGVTDAGLVHLKELKDLRELHLSYTKVTDSGLVHLKEHKNLRKLSLNDTEITDSGLASIAGLTNLRVLKLASCDPRVDDIIGTYEYELRKRQSQRLVGQIPALLGEVARARVRSEITTALMQSGAPLSDSGLKHLSGLKELRELDLSQALKLDAGSGLKHLSGLKELRKLDLSVTPITDSDLVHLFGLAELRELDLMYTPFVTDSGYKELRKALPKCDIRYSPW